MLEITLYTKEGCHLCEEVVAILDGLQDRYAHRLTAVDITEDDVLYEQYRYAIPVVQIGEAELRAPITEEELEEALRASGQGV